MKRRFFIFTVMAMIAMTMSFVGCDKNKTIIPNEQTNTEEIETNFKSVYANYYPSSAVSYALQYATSPNSSYFEWDSDCANFVSQSLSQGGGLYQDGTWWYNTNGSSNVNYHSGSNAWKRAGDLYNYLNNSAYYKTVTTFYSWSSNYKNYMEEGDIVFLYGNRPGADGQTNYRFYHVVMVTDKDYYDVYISGHDDGENYPLYDVWDDESVYLDYIKVIHLE